MEKAICPKCGELNNNENPFICQTCHLNVSDFIKENVKEVTTKVKAIAEVNKILIDPKEGNIAVVQGKKKFWGKEE